jgi:hypothetical protein
MITNGQQCDSTCLCGETWFRKLLEALGEWPEWRRQAQDLHTLALCLDLGTSSSASFVTTFNSVNHWSKPIALKEGLWEPWLLAHPSEAQGMQSGVWDWHLSGGRLGDRALRLRL